MEATSTIFFVDISKSPISREQGGQLQIITDLHPATFKAQYKLPGLSAVS